MIGYVWNVISGPYSPSFKTIFLPTLNKLWDKLLHFPPFPHTYLVTLSNSCPCRHKSDQHRANIWISAEEICQFVNCLRCNFKHFYAEYIYGRLQSFLSIDHSRTQSPSYATRGSGQTISELASDWLVLTPDIVFLPCFLWYPVMDLAGAPRLTARKNGSGYENEPRSSQIFQPLNILEMLFFFDTL